MFTTTRKKIFGGAMVLIFICAIMLTVYLIHSIITISDAISALKTLNDQTTADKLASAQVINNYKWALFGSCTWLITTIILTAVLELLLYHQINPFVEKQLPVCKVCGMTLEEETPFCPYCGHDMTSNQTNNTPVQLSQPHKKTTAQSRKRTKKED